MVRQEIEQDRFQDQAQYARQLHLFAQEDRLLVAEATKEQPGRQTMLLGDAQRPLFVQRQGLAIGEHAKRQGGFHMGAIDANVDDCDGELRKHRIREAEDRREISLLNLHQSNHDLFGKANAFNKAPIHVQARAGGQRPPESFSPPMRTVIADTPLLNNKKMSREEFKLQQASTTHDGQAQTSSLDRAAQKEQILKDVVAVFPDICPDHLETLFCKNSQSCSDVIVFEILDKMEQGLQYPKKQDKKKTLKRKLPIDQDEEDIARYIDINREVAADFEYRALT